MRSQIIDLFLRKKRQFDNLFRDPEPKLRTHLDANSKNINNLADPAEAQDAVTKKWAEDAFAPIGAMTYKGTWDASTNTPTLADGTGDTGDVYLVNVGGTIDLGNGAITFDVGDYVVYNGTLWQRHPHGDIVDSVNGKTGVVELGAEDIDIADAGGLYSATETEGALQEIAGSGRSSETVKDNADDITDLAGAGRTTETVKDNADDVDDLAGAGRTTETVKGNADDIAAQDTAKADKVTGATADNFAGLDADGNLIDSGHKDADYEDAFAKKTAFNKDFDTTPANIKMDGVQAVGSSGKPAHSDHVHPSDDTKLDKALQTQAISASVNTKILTGISDRIVIPYVVLNASGTPIDYNITGVIPGEFYIETLQDATVYWR